MARYRRLLAFVLVPLGAGGSIVFLLVAPALGMAPEVSKTLAILSGACLGGGLRFFVVDRLERRARTGRPQ
ncbi:hypothetical protein KNO15_00130 [Leifsonia shinshuensis]|uniref:hypothetical protein n=1 Tax=Leifsonia shinshuensis TaxID=150026 RepID=UPI001F511AFE|nr:hypothetical protein [Leifsonia shinshuensis]MCI0155109.1 hypothetical protein [Leifsonia shinshuensis]